MLQIWHGKDFQAAIDQLRHLGRLQLEKVFFRPVALRWQAMGGFPGRFTVLGWNSWRSVRHGLNAGQKVSEPEHFSQDILEIRKLHAKPRRSFAV